MAANFLFLPFLPLAIIIILFVVPSRCHGGYWPPSPGYYPGSNIRSFTFNQAFTNIWGPSHQSVDNNNGLRIWLDTNSGSAFKSVKPYRSGHFGATIKLQPGYTAGVITAFYLSNAEAHPGFHDEVDIEFLGTTFGKPYTLQTNVYVRGSGDGNIVGREMKFHLWFDPTQGFHNYAIIWNPREIVFLVDDVPIRWYPRRSAETFPLRPMWIYGSIWDASAWATENGKYKADYRYQPFVGQFKNFKVGGCTAWASRWCHVATAGPYRSSGLTWQQRRAMRWVQSHYLVYNYCKDSRRDLSRTPECLL